MYLLDIAQVVLAIVHVYLSLLLYNSWIRDCMLQEDWNDLWYGIRNCVKVILPFGIILISLSENEDKRPNAYFHCTAVEVFAKLISSQVL